MIRFIVNVGGTMDIVKGQSLWNEIREELKNTLVESTFEETFNDVTRVCKVENGYIYVVTPSSYYKHKINNNYYKTIDVICKKITNENVKFKFINNEEIKSDPIYNKPKSVLKTTDLDQNYNFESFVICDSNRVATLAAVKVADQPGYVFNPLYIFGGVGLGKTHLMQAIGNYIAEKDINNKILYVQANDYFSDYTKAASTNNYQAFEDKYADIDVLLIDDIQILNGKNSTQQEFFKLFDYLDKNKKQIVITSDRPANKLNGFMDRLTTRFQKGLTVNINQPTIEDRLNILKHKVQNLTTKPVSDEILLYIASNIENIRIAEGALNNLLFYSELNNVDPNIEIAEEVLDLLLKNKKKEDKPNYEDVLSIIASIYNINVSDILGNSKLAKYVLPRHIAMYVLKEKYDLSYKTVGNILNNRDHTTVLNGYNNIKQNLDSDEELKMAVDMIMKKI